eukprot:g17129.t1
MLSVAGLERAKLEPLCKEAAAKEAGGVCSVANCLFPSGFSVGGTEQAINTLKDLAEKNGALQEKIGTIGVRKKTLPNMKPPLHTVWMNASAQPIRPGSDPAEIVALLKRQLTNPVLWEDSMKAIIREGVKEFYECGPMKQIKAMMKRIDAAAWKTTTNIEV